jgi:hypothetical protein
VGVGHALNYLPDADAVNRALLALARALRPGGLFAVDVCDLEWGETHADDNRGWVGEDWAIVSRFSLPTPDRYVREMTTFVRTEDGSWRETTSGTTTCWSIPPPFPPSWPLRVLR